MADPIITKIGDVSAYLDAVAHGFEGTRAEFGELLANSANYAQSAANSATSASASATTAMTKATEATTAATAAQTAKTQTEAAASQALTDIATARSGAISAVQTEGATQTANATAQAQAAATSATTASTKASEASASATTATTKATEAAASATSAANAASAAQGVLESIPEDYSDLSEDVDQLKADLESMTSASRNILTEEWEHGIYTGSGEYLKANNSNTSNTTIPPVIDVEPNTKYTISWGMTDNTAGTIYVFQYASDGTYIKSLSLSFANGKYTFTTDSTAKRVGIQRYTYGASAWTDLTPPWTQMEVGDTATPYISSRIINPELVITDATFSDTVLPANSKAVGDFINDIFAQSRNLFNLKWNHATYNSSGEYIEQSASSSSNGATLKLEVEGGKRYTLSWGDAEVETGNVYFLQFGQNGEHLSTTSAKFATHEISIGVDATTKYVAFNRYGTGASSWTQLIPEWTQLEIGERTPYISPKAFAGKYIDYTLFLQRVVDAVESTINISSVDRSNITVPTIAHRGETLFAPQCTAPAYIAAKKYGHKIAENDVYISSDGYFVMWHDTTLNRLGNLQDINGYLIYTDGTDFYYVNGTSVYTWNGTQYVLSDVPIGNLTRCAGSNYSVTALTLAQLKRIDFGVYMGTQFSGTQILTFDEWVLICKQVGLYLYIDFKIAATSEQLSQLAGIVKRYGMSQYASWILNGTQINAVRAVIPNARILVMATPDTSNIQTLTPYLANGKIAYDLNGNIGETINSEAITLALNSGFEVGMWLVGYSASDADKNAVFTRIRELLSYGVTELTLDHYKVEDAFLEWFND